MLKCFSFSPSRKDWSKHRRIHWRWCFSSWSPGACWDLSRPGGGCRGSRTQPGSSRCFWCSLSSSAFSSSSPLLLLQLPGRLAWTWCAWETGGESGRWGDDSEVDTSRHRRPRQTPWVGRWIRNPPAQQYSPAFSSWNRSETERQDQKLFDLSLLSVIIENIDVEQLS